MKRTILPLIMMVLTLAGLAWSANRSKPPAPPALNKTVQTEPETTTSGVEFTDLEQAFIDILLQDPRQKRKNITFDPVLLAVARARAKDMATRNYFSHTNPDGYGPNYLLKKAGYKLPDWWKNEKAANYIESISGGRATAQDTYTGWMNSPGHKKHVLGEIDFYSSQTVVAIGHYYSAGSTYRHYWVFLSAPKQE